MMVQFTPQEQRILYFLHEDATFDVRLIKVDMTEEELVAANHLIDLGLIELLSGLFYLTTDGISYMVDIETDRDRDDG